MAQVRFEVPSGLTNGDGICGKVLISTRRADLSRMIPAEFAVPVSLSTCQIREGELATDREEDGERNFGGILQEGA